MKLASQASTTMCCIPTPARLHFTLSSLRSSFRSCCVLTIAANGHQRMYVHCMHNVRWLLLFHCNPQRSVSRRSCCCCAKHFWQWLLGFGRSSAVCKLECNTVWKTGCDYIFAKVWFINRPVVCVPAWYQLFPSTPFYMITEVCEAVAGSSMLRTRLCCVRLSHDCFLPWLSFLAPCGHGNGLLLPLDVHKSISLGLEAQRPYCSNWAEHVPCTNPYIMSVSGDPFTFSGSANCLLTVLLNTTSQQ